MMTFWQRLGYVARRLGREFLILTLVALVAAFLADWLLYHHYQTLLARWETRYAELFPEPVIDRNRCDGLLQLTTATEALDSQVRSGVEYRAADDEVTRIKSAVFYLNNPPMPALMNNLQQGASPGITARAQREPARFNRDSLLHLQDIIEAVDIALLCDPGSWRGQGSVERFNLAWSTVRYLTAMSLILAIDGEADRCAGALVRASRLAAPLNHLLDHSTYDFQRGGHERVLAMIQHALARNAVCQSSADVLIEELSACHADYLHPLERQTPGESWMSPVVWSPEATESWWIQRVARPLIALQRCFLLRSSLQLADTLSFESASARAAVRRQLAESRSPAAMLMGTRLRGFLEEMDQAELMHKESEGIALMLQLEKHRLRTGSFPETIDPLGEHLPKGFAAASLADPPFEYRVDTDRLGYQLSREVYVHDAPSSSAMGIRSPHQRTWVRRYEEDN